MKIEKLEPPYMILHHPRDIEIYSKLNERFSKIELKINELIDAFNENEKNRSEQMARIIDRLEEVESKCLSFLGDIVSLNSRVCDLENKLRSNRSGCFSYCDKYVGEECDCLLGKDTKSKEEKKPESLPLNCPFCGNSPSVQPYFISLKDQEYFFISCTNNYCCIQPSQKNYCYIHQKFKTKQEAVAAWNTREK